MRHRNRTRAFTLIELLVVVAIIALLIGILLPSLAGARNAGRAIKCAANARSVAQAVVLYTVSNKYFPPSYVYGSAQEGLEWRIDQQLTTNPTPANGYVHWSASLFDQGGVHGDSFKCPSVPNGGAPATNPGNDISNWEPGQVNDAGQSSPSPLPEDRQVKRMAYSGNAAVFTRNKFGLQGSPRRNQLVNPSWIDGSSVGASKTILATEFLTYEGWRSISTSSEYKVKSHRAITPFIGGSSGTDVYNEPNGGSEARFFYPPESSILRKDQLGVGMIEDGNSALNAVGRHHPGGDNTYGGTANFSFVDGHVEQMTVLESIRKRLWGERFYSITGNNRVGTTP
jgi:prepilin-type N-terminal cleavage/methylation domain-containing protein/prepilin-type processing-associated H-X9-DG protein